LKQFEQADKNVFVLFSIAICLKHSRIRTEMKECAFRWTLYFLWGHAPCHLLPIRGKQSHPGFFESWN